MVLIKHFHVFRSRNLIIRELQRTNLDVNLAVNNLLSRDEEGDDDADDSQGDYVPEDLISLLDAGISADHPSVIIDADAMFNEDMFGYSQTRGRSSSTARRCEIQLSYLKALNMCALPSSFILCHVKHKICEGQVSEAQSASEALLSQTGTTSSVGGTASILGQSAGSRLL